MQTAADANALLKYHFNIGVQVVTDGTKLYEKKIQMEVNLCQIIVATPRRLLDHIDSVPDFSNRLMGLELLVLDEADRLLSLGFHEDLYKIIDSVPRHRQSLLFSATIRQEVHQMSQITLKRDHAFINTVGLACPRTHAKAVQRCIVNSHEDHFNLLYGVLMEHISRESDYKVLVFCITPAVATVFYEVLLGLNMNVQEINSRKSKVYGSHMYDELQHSKGLILVMSDVSAHGVDYPDVTFIVQVGIPSDREQYIHRFGSTGLKAKGRQGLLLLAPWEEYFLADVQDFPIKKASFPEVDLEMKSRVEHAITNVNSSVKEYAYRAWLAYYNSVRAIDKRRLVELANQFSCCIGLEQPPEMWKRTVEQMGLDNIPGLRIKN